MSCKQNQKKLQTILIALILISSIAMPLIALPTNAATANTKQSYAFCGVIPNYTGVSQAVTLHIGISAPTSHPQEGWTGITVTVTKPDNTTEKLGPIMTDTTGGTGVQYVPAMTGTYYFQTNFPEQVNLYGSSGTPANTTMLASDSEKMPLYVLEESIQYYPGQTLPTEYWSRPINSQLREWSSIAGNWVATPVNSLALSNAAPMSAHILWSREIATNGGGGLVGGELNDAHGYITGEAYEQKYIAPTIIAGVLYYNRYISSNPVQEVVAMDLHTGEELWVKNWNNTALSFGQILLWETGNAHGAYSFLWSVVGSTWNAYDPVSGTWVFSLKNVPAGTNYYGPNGEILRYTVDTTNGRLLRWNSTWAVKSNDYNRTVYSGWSLIAGHSQLIGKTLDASNGYDLNVTIPKGQGTARATLSDRIIMGNIGDTQTNLWGISTKAEQEGTLLFNTTWNNPSAWITGNQTVSWSASSSDDLVGILYSKEVRQNYGVSLETGQLIWGPTPSEYYLGQYAQTANIAYGKLYTSGICGTVNCYDVKSGNRLWIYNATDTYVEYKVGPNWLTTLAFISDGKVYVGHGEHSAGDPKGRDAPFVCLNATTGDVIWSISGAFRQTMGSKSVIGDSIIAAMDTYDQQICAVGKGPSQVTVSAPSAGVTTATPITISGTVMDISPGTSQDAIEMRFPNGVPAVSDDSQSDWMLYVYKQFAQPSNATGVPVTLSVADANGNYREIGTITSDASGFYSYSWTPDIPGKYTVYASFAGSAAYYPSHAVTAFTADEAIATATPTTQQTGLATTADLLTYMLAGVIAIIIAIAIIGLLIIRKK